MTYAGPRWVLIPRFCALTGYTEKAVRRKIETGKWAEGVIWKKGPDRHIFVNLEAYEQWVEEGMRAFARAATASR